mgnify:CR=1 FL=1
MQQALAVLREVRGLWQHWMAQLDVVQPETGRTVFADLQDHTLRASWKTQILKPLQSLFAGAAFAPLLAACKARGVPVFLVNARLSERSARGYARVAPLTRAALRGLAGVAAQTAADALPVIKAFVSDTATAIATAAAVTSVSGRGVGIDVARERGNRAAHEVQHARRAVDRGQFDGHAPGRRAAGEVQDVRRQATHACPDCTQSESV